MQIYKNNIFANQGEINLCNRFLMLSKIKNIDRRWHRRRFRRGHVEFIGIIMSHRFNAQRFNGIYRKCDTMNLQFDFFNVHCSYICIRSSTVHRVRAQREHLM